MDMLRIDHEVSIVTPRLKLEPPCVSEENITSYIEAIAESLDRLRLWLPWAKYVPNRMQAEEYIQSCMQNWSQADIDAKAWLVFWVRDRYTEQLVGSIVIWNILWEIPRIEFGFWLRNSALGQGYITEAVNALTLYAFLSMGVNRIEIRCERENWQAQAVPKRLNFDLDGTLKRSTRAIATGELTDTVMFSRVGLDNLPNLQVNW